MRFEWIVLLTLLIYCEIVMSQDDEYKTQRTDMVDYQIRQRGITDAKTIKAMMRVPRHLFVPTYLQELAYTDQPLPIGNNQTISQPYIVAFMTSILDLKTNDKVLEIGTGSGYQAAVLAEIADSVFTVEIVEDLCIQAGKLLQKLGYDNVKVRCGDGYSGWPEFAPFDKIIVTAAADSVPPKLLEQLKENGKMIIPVGPLGYTQNLVLIEKSHGSVKFTEVLPVRFVPFMREKQE